MNDNKTWIVILGGVAVYFYLESVKAKKIAIATVDPQTGAVFVPKTKLSISLPELKLNKPSWWPEWLEITGI